MNEIRRKQALSNKNREMVKGFFEESLSQFSQGNNYN